MTKPDQGRYTEKWVEALRLALDYTNSGEIAEQHVATIRRAVEAAFLEAVDNLERLESTANEGKAWRAAEVEALETFLKKRMYVSTWHEEEEVLEMAAQRFKRNQKSIKRKAIELGYADRVDYWLSKDKNKIYTQEKPA